jgi:hypothetical protein
MSKSYATAFWRETVEREDVGAKAVFTFHDNSVSKSSTLGVR